MPAQPACFHRLDEILGALRSIEKLFRVRERSTTAHAISGGHVSQVNTKLQCQRVRVL